MKKKYEGSWMNHIKEGQKKIAKVPVCVSDTRNNFVLSDTSIFDGFGIIRKTDMDGDTPLRITRMPHIDSYHVVLERETGYYPYLATDPVAFAEKLINLHEKEEN